MAYTVEPHVLNYYLDKIRADIRKKSTAAIKRAKHSKKKSPWSSEIWVKITGRLRDEDDDIVPRRLIVERLFDAHDVFSREETSRTIKWEIVGESRIISFLNAEDDPFISPVELSGMSSIRVRVNPLTGEVPHMVGVAGYDELQAKFNLNTQMFTLRFKTYLRGMRAEQHSMPSPAQLMYQLTMGGYRY